VYHLFYFLYAYPGATYHQPSSLTFHSYAFYSYAFILPARTICCYYSSLYLDPHYSPLIPINTTSQIVFVCLARCAFGLHIQLWQQHLEAAPCIAKSAHRFHANPALSLMMISSRIKQHKIYQHVHIYIYVCIYIYLHMSAKTIAFKNVSISDCSQVAYDKLIYIIRHLGSREPYTRYRQTQYIHSSTYISTDTCAYRVEPKGCLLIPTLGYCGRKMLCVINRSLWCFEKHYLSPILTPLGPSRTSHFSHHHGRSFTFFFNSFHEQNYNRTQIWTSRQPVTPKYPPVYHLSAGPKMTMLTGI